MALSALYESNGTVGSTEFSLVNGSTTLAAATGDGVMQGSIDASAMAAGDVYELNVYEKVRGSDSKLKFMPTITLNGAQTTAVVIPAFIMLYGWDVTLKKIAGTDRNFVWSLRVAG